MALGKRPRQVQSQMWLATAELDRPPGDPFYTKFNEILAEAGFDDKIEALAREHAEPGYAAVMGRPSLPPGIYVRMTMIGFLEGIDSQRQIAWRCRDSLSLRAFLGYDLTQSTPDHSTLSITHKRLDAAFHQEVFDWVTHILAERGLIKGEVIGLDASTMDANASMRSLVRRDTGENYADYTRRLAEDKGMENPTDKEVRNFDRTRKKKTSNKDWMNPHDPDAKVAKMKKGNTHMAYKPEHAVDLETGALLAAEIHTAEKGDTTTGPRTRRNVKLRRRR